MTSPTPQPDSKATAQLGRRKRSLVWEILSAQTLYAIVIAGVAIASLTSGASWVIKENVTAWAQRWADDLENLGVGLYSATDNARYTQIKSYVEQFPEISYIRYYNDDGMVIFQDTLQQTDLMAPQLEAQHLSQLRTRASDEVPHIFKQLPGNLGVSLSRAVVITKTSTVSLLEAESLDSLPVESEFAGFIEMGLDYSTYDAQIAGKVTEAARLAATIFGVFLLLGWWFLRRALQPLQRIQGPLQALAEGQDLPEVKNSPYREIDAIHQGLQNAAAKIRDRDQHLTYLAHHDDLTGLPNRVAGVAALKAMLAGNEKPLGVVMFIDLDQFKYINDTLGHQAGDLAIRQAASRIQATVNDSSTLGQGHVARFGGDEFCVALSGVTVRQGQKLAEAIMSNLTSVPFMYDSQSFSLTCSIGISAMESGATPDDVLARADFSCQQAKTDGRNRVRIFEPDSNSIQELQQEVSWSQKLQEALRDDHFVLFFQPILNLRTNRVGHYEVLLRMREGEKLHAPGAFLDAAHRFGLMHQIDRWVLENALQELAQKRKVDPELRFTINITAKAFAEGNLVQFVKQHLKANKLDPSALILEITEQTAVESLSDANRQIDQLIQLGVEFALDDFGAGYSSFNYLKSLPMQYVKIDGQFVKNLDQNEIDELMVKAISDVAHALDKHTVAEFVENADSLNLLRKLGVEYAQGYHIGAPRAELLSQAELDKLSTPAAKARKSA